MIETVEACYRNDGGGAPICWEHVAVPVRSDDGRVANVIRISGDVSARHEAEAELRSLNEGLEQRIDDEVRRRQEGERIADQQARLAAIGELATGMAHEITQPLNAISFSFDNLRSRRDAGSLDDEYFRAKIAAVSSDIERIRRVIDHVRLFARSVPEEYRASFRPADVVDSALTLTGVQLATYGIDVRVERPINDRPIVGNPYKYEQVVLNLLSNARDAIEERQMSESATNDADPVPGRIRISLRDEEGHVVLEVEDNGAGIAPSISQRIFDPFFSTKAQGKGTGLGLSISFGIIRDMNGTIGLLPSPSGRGAVAVVSVPATIESTEASEHGA